MEHPRSQDGPQEGARFLFPRWTNKVPRLILIALTVTVVAVIVGMYQFTTNDHLKVGYRPKQPVDYSHQLHAGTMGMDCRYCHSTVENAAFAAIPATQTCMNCHWKVKTDSVKLLPVRESWALDQPIPWVQVHKVPDYAYFNHGAHLAAGVGCSTCHGRVDQMAQVHQVEPLSMSWCLSCHRNPAPYIRDPSEVTKMDWKPNAQLLSEGYDPNHPPTTKSGRPLNPPTHCSGCHR